VQICLDVLTDLIDDPDREAGKREAALTLSALVGGAAPLRPDLTPVRSYSRLGAIPCKIT